MSIPIDEKTAFGAAKGVAGFVKGGTILGAGIEAVEGVVDGDAGRAKLDKIAARFGMTVEELAEISAPVRAYLGQKDSSPVKNLFTYGSGAAVGAAVGFLTPIPFGSAIGAAAGSYIAGKTWKATTGPEGSEVEHVANMIDQLEGPEGAATPADISNCCFVALSERLPEGQRDMVEETFEACPEETGLTTVNHQYANLMHPMAHQMLGDEYDPALNPTDQFANAIMEGRMDPAMILIDPDKIDYAKDRMAQAMASRPLPGSELDRIAGNLNKMGVRPTDANSAQSIPYNGSDNELAV